ncbi:hypothetical protein GGS20DRAFT_46180 [Poronia punctata]|nr:hypothetical protein GGS20DRAFT_46180 [Poronia punctata]
MVLASLITMVPGMYTMCQPESPDENVAPGDSSSEEWVLESLSRRWAIFKGPDFPVHAALQSRRGERLPYVTARREDSSTSRSPTSSRSPTPISPLILPQPLLFESYIRTDSRSILATVDVRIRESIRESIREFYQRDMSTEVREEGSPVLRDMTIRVAGEASQKYSEADSRARLPTMPARAKARARDLWRAADQHHTMNSRSGRQNVDGAEQV